MADTKDGREDQAKTAEDRQRQRALDREMDHRHDDSDGSEYEDELEDTENDGTEQDEFVEPEQDDSDEEDGVEHADDREEHAENTE